MQILDATIKFLLNEKLEKLEEHFEADVVFFYGEIHAGLIRPFRDMVEDLQREDQKREKFAIILNTSGGSAETAEKLVDIFVIRSDRSTGLEWTTVGASPRIFGQSGGIVGQGCSRNSE